MCVWVVVFVTTTCVMLTVEGERTVVGPRDEPQAAVVLCGVLQSDPQPHHPAQGHGVQERGVLVRSH